MLRKLKRQLPGEPLAARYNWCQGPVLGHGPAVEKHCSRVSIWKHKKKLVFQLFIYISQWLWRSQNVNTLGEFDYSDKLNCLGVSGSAGRTYFRYGAALSAVQPDCTWSWRSSPESSRCPLQWRPCFAVHLSGIPFIFNSNRSSACTCNNLLCSGGHPPVGTGTTL